MERGLSVRLTPVVWRSVRACTTRAFLIPLSLMRRCGAMRGGVTFDFDFDFDLICLPTFSTGSAGSSIPTGPTGSTLSTFSTVTNFRPGLYHAALLYPGTRAEIDSRAHGTS